MSKITSKQIRALWGYAAFLKVAEEDLRGWIFSRTGKSSIRTLTLIEASRLIDEIAWKWEKGVPPPGGDRITAAQIWWIASLGRKIGWDERRAIGLARRMYQVENIHDLDRKRASGLIEALKAIGRRGNIRRAA